MGLEIAYVKQIASGGITPGWTEVVVNFTTPVGCVSAGVYALRDSGLGVDILLWGASLKLAGGGPEILSNVNTIGQAPWELSSVSTTLNFGTDPIGGSQASRATVSVAGHYLRQTATVTASTNYTFRFWAKNNGGTVASYSVYNFSSPSDIVAVTSYFSQLP